MAQPRLNLKNVSVLLVERAPYTRALISQALRGFGIKMITGCETGEAAQELLNQTGFDLCLIESELIDMPGSDLIRYIRKLPREPMRFVPVIALSGYTQFRGLGTVRDAGANLVLKKPISPQALFDRIAWLGRTKRAYIETDNYIGPDRRFHDIDPPGGAYKRATDKSADVSPERPATPALEGTRP
ncbi:MAG TPA: response regulator [Rhizomicrobium sp.]|nr:response regulator [Rhizomicrobium sp.]